MELRKLAAHDLEDYSFWLEPHHAYHALNGPYFEKKSLEEVKEYTQGIQFAFENGDDDPLPQKKVIVDSTDQVIGEVSWYWKSEETSWMEVGIVIFDEGNWGRGIGSFILKNWISELFEENEALVRLGFTTWSGNEGMMRLALKLGMQEEARIRKARKVNDMYYDSVSFGILKEEWFNLKLG